MSGTQCGILLLYTIHLKVQCFAHAEILFYECLNTVPGSSEEIFMQAILSSTNSLS